VEQPVLGKNDTYRFALAAHPGGSWGGQLSSRARSPTMGRPSPPTPTLSGLSSSVPSEPVPTWRRQGNSAWTSTQDLSLRCS